MKHFIKSTAALVLMAASLPAFSGALNIWNNDGWTEMAYTAGYGDGLLDPGVGGQKFDVEYLFYKWDAGSQTLSVGLQTGFDILDGHQVYGGKDYYTGDLALSFDGDKGDYEYAIDFGLLSKGYYGTNLGTQAQGLYAVSDWNNETYVNHGEAHPFAMSAGLLQTNVGFADIGTGSGTTAGGVFGNDDGTGGTSYFRMFSFNLGALGLMGDIGIDAHWTMSCGNDYLDGTVDVTTNVPEPGSLALLGLGLLGLYVARRRQAQE